MWFDKKHLAKKAANSWRLASRTGGGPAMTPPLTQWELKILTIMGVGFGEHQTAASVPAFTEVFIFRNFNYSILVVFKYLF